MFGMLLWAILTQFDDVKSDEVSRPQTRVLSRGHLSNPEISLQRVNLVRLLPVEVGKAKIADGR